MGIACKIVYSCVRFPCDLQSIAKLPYLITRRSTCDHSFFIFHCDDLAIILLKLHFVSPTHRSPSGAAANFLIIFANLFGVCVRVAVFNLSSHHFDKHNAINRHSTMSIPSRTISHPICLRRRSSSASSCAAHFIRIRIQFIVSCAN